MRYLIPEIASPIGFIITTTMFLIFSVIVISLFIRGRSSFVHQENLPLSDD